MVFLSKFRKNRYSKTLVVLLLLLDLLSIYGSFKLSYYYTVEAFAQLESYYLSLSAIFLLAWVVAALFCDLYQIDSLSRIKKIIYSTAVSFVFHFIIINIYLFGFQTYQYPPEFLLYTYALSVAAIITFKVILLLSYRYYRNLDKNRKKVIIVGYTAAGRNLHDFFLKNDSLAYKFMGFFDDNQHSREYYQAPIKGSLQDIKAYCLREDIDEMFYALPNHVEMVRDLAKFADDHYIYFGIVQDVGGLVEKRVDTHMYDNGKIPIMTPRREPLRFFFNRQVKRVFDIAFSSLVLLTVFPLVIPPVALLIKLDSPGPIFFKQLRSGRNGKPFWCYKFRTMCVNNECDTQQARKNDSRITSIGKVLRKTSLDEFPQFFNVFKGDMSVVGPRPHMLKHTEEYAQLIQDFKVRHFINSGITGYAQVNGYRGETKDNSQMEKRVQYDTWYLENWSLSLDIKIIFQTVWNAIKGEENAY